MRDALWLVWVWVIVPAIVVAVLAVVVVVVGWLFAAVGTAIDRWLCHWRILGRRRTVMKTPAPCSHAWIDPNEAAVERVSYSPVVGPGRREMKPGRTYACQHCRLTLTIGTESNGSIVVTSGCR